MTFAEFLMYVQGAGVNAAVGFLLSYLVEWWPEYADLEAKAKRLVMLGLCLVVPLLAAVVGVAMGFQALALETFWQAAQAGFLAFVASQAAHTRKL